MDARTARYLLALERRLGRQFLPVDQMREARAALHRTRTLDRDPDVIHRWSCADYDHGIDYLIVRATTQADVAWILQRNGLTLTATPRPRSPYDCTGRIFGDGPQIREMHPGRWRVIYHWYCDV